MLSLQPALANFFTLRPLAHILLAVALNLLPYSMLKAVLPLSFINDPFLMV
jgi:hypothetical protein